MLHRRIDRIVCDAGESGRSERADAGLRVSLPHRLSMRAEPARVRARRQPDRRRNKSRLGFGGRPAVRRRARGVHRQSAVRNAFDEYHARRLGRALHAAGESRKSPNGGHVFPRIVLRLCGGGTCRRLAGVMRPDAVPGTPRPRGRCRFVRPTRSGCGWGSNPRVAHCEFPFRVEIAMSSTDAHVHAKRMVALPARVETIHPRTPWAVSTPGNHGLSNTI